jgi:predicted phage tail protein
MRKIILDGQLGDMFGREWSLHVATPSQALALIRANRPGLTKYFAECGADGIGFCCTIDGQAVTANRLLQPFGTNEILKISPAYMGAAGDGKSIGQIILGVVLIAVSAFTLGATGVAGLGLLGTGIGAGGTAGFIGALGVSLAFSGAANLLAGQPDFSNPEENDLNKASYLFDGPNNRVRQGNARPLLYGVMLVGGQPISSGVNNEEWVLPPEIVVGTLTGRGYQFNSVTGYASDSEQFLVHEGGPIKQGGYRARKGGLSGSGGKGGGSDTGTEAPDSYRSISSVRAQYLISEGEVTGPVDEDGNLVTTRLAASLYLDETVVQNPDGTLNFKGIKAWFLPGTPDQKHFPGFGGTEIETNIGTEFTTATSITSIVNDPTVDAVRVTVKIPQMYKRDLRTGDTNGYQVTFAFEINYDSAGFVEVARHTRRQKNMNPTLHSYRLELAAFTTDAIIRFVRISEDETKTHLTNRTFAEARVDIQDEKLNHPNTCKLGIDIDATQFSRIPIAAVKLAGIKVQIPSNYDSIERTYSGVWDGSYDVEHTSNPAWIFLDLMTSVRYGLGRWITLTQNDVAELYTIAQACDVLVTQGINKAGTIVETFAIGVTTIKISIPGSWIEDGDTLTIAGGTITVDGKIRRGARDEVLTSGSLTVGATYRINDASGSADFVVVGATSNDVDVTFEATGTTPTWGTGKLQPMYFTATVDATTIAGTQDEAVSWVGREPRYECNLYLQTAVDAYKAISDIASVWRGMAYWGGGLFKAVQDVAKDSIIHFTNASVSEKGFKYAGTALKARHTVAHVRFNDPKDFYRARIIYVEDAEGVFKYGVRVRQLVAYGCTSESQAMRHARQVLIGERRETLGIEFEAGLEAHALQVGEIFDTYDNDQSSVVLTGRLIEVTQTSATLDRDITFVDGSTYQIQMVKKDGTGLVTTTITSAAGARPDITFTSIDVADLPATLGTYMIQDTSAATKRSWRCLSIGEKERGLYNIIGFEYDGDKFAEIDDIEQDAATADTADTRLVLPVSNLDVVTERLSNDRSDKRFATATWDPSLDPHLRNYRVSYRQNDGDWSPTIMTFATNLRIEIDGPGIYEFTVTAINSFSFASGPITSTFTVAETGLVVGFISPPVLIPIEGVVPDGVDLTNMVFLNGEGESEIRYTETQEVQATSGTLESGKEYEIIASTTGVVLTSGATTASTEYRITNTGSGGLVVTNCGAADNNLGTVFTANGNTPTSYGTAGELTPNTYSDFVVSGSADNAVETFFVANSSPPIWGTDGELRLITDNDPLTSTGTVTTYNPNWLLWTQKQNESAWVVVTGEAPRRFTSRADPKGSHEAYFVVPAYSVDMYQAISYADTYVGQPWVCSFWARRDSLDLKNANVYIEETGGAEADSTTILAFEPTMKAWGRHEVLHTIEQPDRTGLRIRLEILQTDDPTFTRLKFFGFQLEIGEKATSYVENTSTPGGKFTVSAYAGTTSIRARTFVTDDLYSSMTEESYDFATGATQVADPILSPPGGDFIGASFPQTITIENYEAGVVTTYTIDGTDPLTSGTAITYSAPFEVAAGITVQTAATKASFTDSEIVTASYQQGF